MKVFAHRGTSGKYPENTLLAFKKALVEQCDGIELDVQYHPSGELILSHDSHILNKEQRPEKIQNIPIDELLKLPAGQGEFIATLPQALQCIQGQCELNIEIKAAYIEHHHIPDVCQHIVKAINHAVAHQGFTYEQFIISSFNHYIIQDIKQQLPQIRIAALLASCPIGFTEFTASLTLWGINLALDCVNQTFIDHAHQQGLQVGVYTVNSLEDIKQCLRWQVDSIFSDFPAQTQQHIKNITNTI